MYLVQGYLSKKNPNEKLDKTDGEIIKLKRENKCNAFLLAKFVDVIHTCSGENLKWISCTFTKKKLYKFYL